MIPKVARFTATSVKVRPAEPLARNLVSAARTGSLHGTSCPEKAVSFQTPIFVNFPAEMGVLCDLDTGICC